jgi:hypothetical protein
MDSIEKLKITCEEFTAKLNERLRANLANESMVFLHDRAGFELPSPVLKESERMELSKTMFDEVSGRYAIAFE